MKRLNFLFVPFMILSISGCNAQPNASDKCITMLKEFYTSYYEVWKIRPIPHPNDHYVKIDSVQKKYCTQKIRKEAKERFFDGHDLLTNDWGLDLGSLNSMTIVRDPNKHNTYIVSYIIDLSNDPPYESLKKDVTLYVDVVKEGNSFRIDAVR